MWAFGTVLWELITTDIPEGELRALRASEAPQIIIDIIKRCHEDDPAKRPTAKEVHDAIEYSIM